MYKDQADDADSRFFPTQKETLCQWYYQDPVDQTEWDRTWMIADIQGDNPNPFVLDCTLPLRSYCEGLGYDCVVGMEEVTPQIGILYPCILLQYYSLLLSRHTVLLLYVTLNE